MPRASNKSKERLRLFYRQFSGEDYVLIPINADPDSIASAMAVKRMLWRKTANVTISNVNDINRPDNLTMIRLVDAKLVPFKEVDTVRFNRVVMVDSQPDHHEALAGLTPHVVIDHHPVSFAGDAPFVDIRPAYGACASILTEYLRAAKIKLSVKLATSLYYAIKSDTSNFERKTIIEDLNAFQYVFRRANTAMAYRIEQAEMHTGFLKYFKRAIEERRLRKGRAFVHLGRVIHPDICVQVADFFLRINTVNWSIVSGLHQRKLVIIFRNDGIRKNAGVLAKESFGRWGSAGGHKSAARAEIPLDAIEKSVNCADRNKVAQWIMRQLKQRGVKRK
ncbi:MAG: DHH family phosphoesterase [Desulfobacteraceae bacterium]|jgi:nanoRNase/pAp phosphatase (c-di-AMP/oligoRNAs hydrolase)